MLQQINTSLYLFIFGLSGQIHPLDMVMIFTTKYLIYVLGTVAVIAGLKGSQKEKQSLILTVISTAVALVFVELIHHFYFEPRPFITLHTTPLTPHDADASFPSMHTVGTFVIAFSFLFNKSKFWPWFMAVAILIGISRVFVGVHYPFDVLGGILIALLGVTIGHFIWKWYRKIPLW